MAVDIALFPFRIDHNLVGFIPELQIRFFPAGILKSIEIPVTAVFVIITDKDHKGLLQAPVFHSRCQDTDIYDRLIVTHSFRKIAFVAGLYLHIIYGTGIIRYVQVEPHAFGIIPFLFRFLQLDQLDLFYFDLQDVFQQRFQVPGVPHDLREHVVIH